MGGTSLTHRCAELACNQVAILTPPTSLKAGGPETHVVSRDAYGDRRRIWRPETHMDRPKTRMDTGDTLGQTPHKKAYI